MIRKLLAATLIGALMLALPGSSKVANAAETQFIRIATLAPRDSDLAKSFLKIDKGMRAATNNGWGVRLYPSGVAGDEVDVIRKMKVGQMDASIITSTGLSQIVREVNVLDAPGVVTNYKQLEAIQAALTPSGKLRSRRTASSCSRGARRVSTAGSPRTRSTRPATSRACARGCGPRAT